MEKAREAYLAAIRIRAAEYGYASGQRTIQDDIEHLWEAEQRRTPSEPARGGRHTAPDHAMDGDPADFYPRVPATGTSSHGRPRRAARGRERRRKGQE